MQLLCIFISFAVLEAHLCEFAAFPHLSGCIPCCQKWVHRGCGGVEGGVYKVMKTLVCRGCVHPMTSAWHAGVDVGACANLDLVDKWISFVVWVTCWVWMGMLVQLRGPEFGLNGVNLGSWCHCLPLGVYHWWWEGDCATVVCAVVCCMEVRLGPWEESEVALWWVEMGVVEWVCCIGLQHGVRSKWLREGLGLDGMVSVLW